jgi:hypothetical protein
MVPWTILVASYTDLIYTLSFDPTPLTGSPTLKLLAQTPVGYHPSWIGSHPSNNSLIIQGSNRQMEKSSQSSMEWVEPLRVERWWPGPRVVVQTLVPFLSQRTSLSLEM